MALPYSRNQTYVAGTTPIAAADMNGLQDDDVLHHRILTGEDFYLYDDFCGTNIDLTKWIDAVAFALWTIVPNRAGASGCLRGLSTVDAQGDDMQTCLLEIGSNNLRYQVRVEVASNKSADNSSVVIGFSAEAHFCPGTGNRWFININGVLQDSGVAITPATFQVLEMRRASGVSTFLIDGAVVYTTSDVINLATGALTLAVSRTNTTNTDVYFDYAKLWFAR